VEEGAKLLASEAPGVVKRRALFRLDQAYLDGCAAVADGARAAARAAEAPTVQQGRSQADVDLWDGRAMVIADMVVTAFATAHAIDARVRRAPRPQRRQAQGAAEEEGRRRREEGPRQARRVAAAGRRVTAGSRVAAARHVIPSAP